jgi:predicted transposase YbfD/YdcC
MTRENALKEMLGDVEDPRQPSNGTRHDFVEMLFMTIAAVLSDCDTIEDVAAWSRAHIGWLQRFVRLKNGIPSQDTFLRVFRLRDPKPFEACFRRWVGRLIPDISGMIAVDGKTVRGSGIGGETAIHRVSAFETRMGLVLAQEKVSKKSNEIKAIPELLDALNLKGFLVSIDAMGCQRAIAEKIVAKGADSLLAVKGNQPTLHAAIHNAFLDRKDQVVHVEQVEQGHGRVVAQRCSILPAADSVCATDWPQSKIIVRIDSMLRVKGKPSKMEQRDYVGSRSLTPTQVAEAVRSHWGIENRLHWVLDVTMKEDASTVRKDNAPENRSLVKKIALNLLRMDTTDSVKSSLRLKRKRAAWDDELRARFMGLVTL